MTIVETTIFTKQIQSMLTDEEYRILQNEMIMKPDKGAMIQGSGGLRKMRWSAHGVSFGRGHGKRGGLRIIYYWFQSNDILLMLFAYRKSQRDDLTHEQLRILKKIIEEYYR